jgi:thiol-disulfide isomerase/thioredoxin
MMASWILGLLAIVTANSAGDCVALQFRAPNCGPCEEQQAVIDRLVQEGWIIRQIDATRDRELAERWRITQIPTIVVLHRGKEVDRIVGTLNYDKFRQRLVQSSSNPTPKTRPDSSATSPEAPSTPEKSSSRIVRGQSQEPIPTTPRDLPHDPKFSAVRIRVEGEKNEAVGTGTIVHRDGNEYFVLTCGHLFRDVQEKTPIFVEVFGGPPEQMYPARVVDFQADETDIGMISFVATQRLVVAGIRPSHMPLREGEKVFSLGCNRGADPTRWDSHITKLNRYLGPSNIEVSKAPVQGRSGGGLFDAQGFVIGVCYAADKELDEGLYAGMEVILDQIERVGLGHLVKGSQAPPSLVARNLPPNGPPATTGRVVTAAAAVPTSPHAPTEVIAIIKQPGADDRIISIANISPSLLQALESHGSPISGVR